MGAASSIPVAAMMKPQGPSPSALPKRIAVAADWTTAASGHMHLSSSVVVRRGRICPAIA
ncbi:hypothetical protein J1614_002134 [Plenodomus biglobosus]|nr:hypothetical protein J1614_002134 [Plenodomus biglobosus]